MSLVILARLAFCMSVAAATQIPFLPNVTLVPKYNSRVSPSSIARAISDLCESNFSYAILNCFPNNSCQLFVNAPRTYTLKPTPNAVLYFPRQILPNVSQCCMPNTTDLLQRLSNATSLYALVNGPRCLVMDDHGYLVTVSHTDQSIVSFHSNNLTKIDQSPSSLFSGHPMALAYHNGAYYVAFDYYILVVDSNTMTLLHNISASALQGARDMIFLSDGQQMIVTAAYSNCLIFFNRSSPTSHNYDFIGYQNVSCQGPHGLFFVDDGLFYAISFYNNTVYKYSKPGNATGCSETLAATASSVSSAYGNHVTIDGCDRYWLSLGGARSPDSPIGHGLLAWLAYILQAQISSTRY